MVHHRNWFPLSKGNYYFGTYYYVKAIFVQDYCTDTHRFKCFWNLEAAVNNCLMVVFFRFPQSPPPFSTASLNVFRSGLSFFISPKRRSRRARPSEEIRSVLMRPLQSRQPGEESVDRSDRCLVRNSDQTDVNSIFSPSPRSCCFRPRETRYVRVSQPGLLTDPSLLSSVCVRDNLA